MYITFAKENDQLIFNWLTTYVGLYDAGWNNCKDVLQNLAGIHIFLILNIAYKRNIWYYLKKSSRQFENSWHVIVF
jgi:hypothetical protein